LWSHPSLKETDQKAKLFTRLLGAAVMRGDVITTGRRHRDIASSPGLRFPPFEIVAQRLLQPILAGIFLRGRYGLVFVFILLVLHREPVRMTGAKTRWAKCMHWLLCRNGRGMSGIALSPRGADLLASPLSEYIVFRPPSLQSPIPGASMRSAAANIGKWQRKGVTPAKSSNSRSWPARRGAGGAGRGNREPDRPATEPMEAVAGVPR
jgi:hypothetical protein